MRLPGDKGHRVAARRVRRRRRTTVWLFSEPDANFVRARASLPWRCDNRTQASVNRRAHRAQAYYGATATDRLTDSCGRWCDVRCILAQPKLISCRLVCEHASFVVRTTRNKYKTPRHWRCGVRMGTKRAAAGDALEYVRHAIAILIQTNNLRQLRRLQSISHVAQTPFPVKSKSCRVARVAVGACINGAAKANRPTGKKRIKLAATLTRKSHITITNEPLCMYRGGFVLIRLARGAARRWQIEKRVF